MKRRRPRTLHLVVLTLLAAGVLAHRLGVLRFPRGGGPESPERRRHPCELLDVVDGDTIVVRWRGKTEHVRLLRVNTPEQDQPGHKDSEGFLRDFLTRTGIELEFERSRTVARDRYGRLLAYVFADGENANVALVRAGWSRYWTRYGRGRYAEVFEEAEAEAKRQRRGLWRKEQQPDIPSPNPPGSIHPRSGVRRPAERRLAFRAARTKGALRNIGRLQTMPGTPGLVLAARSLPERATSP